MDIHANAIANAIAYTVKCQSSGIASTISVVVTNRCSGVVVASLGMVVLTLVVMLVSMLLMILRGSILKQYEEMGSVFLKRNYYFGRA